MRTFFVAIYFYKTIEANDRMSNREK